MLGFVCRSSRGVGIAGVLLLLVAPALLAQPPDLELSLEPVVSGLHLPVGIVDAGDGSGRLFVLEQTGVVRVVQGGEILQQPFLDLSGEVSCCGERGLLGLAFHPRFPDDPRLFVHHTDRVGDVRVVEYRATGPDPRRPERADPDSARTLLAVAQPFSNHNGGQLAFGPDGFLYVGLGDGGSAGDPFDNAQDPRSLLGKILRIDVDRADPGLPYAVPPGNPSFAGTPGARREVWAYGLRNPWRFSFDRVTGELFIGDVGQNRWEEIDLLQPGRGGVNLGWRLREGAHCFQPPTGCGRSGLVDPILEYSRDQGCSVTGGFRYRGRASPGLTGVYLFGDFCSGTIWGATPGESDEWTATTLLETGFAVSSFGEDGSGEVYVMEYAAAPGGRVHRIAATGSGPGGGPSPGEPGGERPDDSHRRPRVELPFGAEPP